MVTIEYFYTTKTAFWAVFVYFFKLTGLTRLLKSYPMEPILVRKSSDNQLALFVFNLRISGGTDRFEASA